MSIKRSTYGARPTARSQQHSRMQNGARIALATQPPGACFQPVRVDGSSSDAYQASETHPRERSGVDGPINAHLKRIDHNETMGG